MATHLKTVEYPFAANTTSLAGSTKFSFTGITVTIPETSGRTIVSAYVEFIVNSNGTTGMNAYPTFGCTVGGAAESTFTPAFDTTNTLMFQITLTENVFLVDFTSYVNTNFSGTSQTISASYKIPAAVTINTSAKLIITYQYDETNTTRAKTVRIPLEGGTTLLSTSFAQIGSATEIPNLSTFLPEASVSIQQVWFEITTIEEYQGAGYALGLALDSETGVQDGTHNVTGQSGGDKNQYIFYWVRNDMTTNATHAFKAKSVTTASSFSNVSVVLCVTYTYNHSTTTTVLNSLVIPLQAYMGAYCDTAANAFWYTKKFFIEDALPTLVQSAVSLGWVVGAQTDGGGSPWTVVPSLIVGSQTARTYGNPHANGSGQVGIATIQQRIDSGGAKGAGMTLTSGEVSATAQFYLDASGGAATDHNLKVEGSHAVLYLNYTSTKASDDGLNTHTARWLYVPTVGTDPANQYRATTATLSAPSIPETSYWISALGVRMPGYDSQGGRGVLIKYGAGEGPGFGYFTLFPQIPTSDLGAYKMNVFLADVSSYFDRFPGDVDSSRMDPTASRSLQVGSVWAGGFAAAVEMLVTYHGFVYAAAGAITGYSSTGSGITVNAFRADTNELIGTATTTTGGVFSIPWYDNTVNLYVDAYQDGTHVGRSNIGKAA